MAARAKYTGPVEALALYDALVDGVPDVDRKGASRPYTSRNGHMFSFLDPDGLFALRLPAAARDAFLTEFPTEPVYQYGAHMKEYVEVPAQLLKDTEALRDWFVQSYDYIGTLPANPTTRS